MSYIEHLPGKDGESLLLTGEWTMSNAAGIEEEIIRSRNGAASVDASRIRRLDTAGAWLLRKYFSGTTVHHLSKRNQALLDFLPENPVLPEKPQKTPALISTFTRLGKGTAWSVNFLYGIFVFLGQIFTRMGRNFRHPLHYRLPSIVRHIYETGIQALPIIGLLAFGISMVISYQGAVQLRKFGADIYTIDLTVISLLREMAVLVTAIMVAGRTGSAFAAEIGVMKLRGEVDALRTMGMDPMETLVIPRLIALLLTLPALAFFADVIGLAGGGVMATMQLNISLPQYLDRVANIATWQMVFVGVIKAPIFALLITAVCTYQGMSATGSAENVGALTTLAVVQSIFLVIMSDALFSIVFAKVDI